jgi:hippurate hydrolase
MGKDAILIGSEIVQSIQSIVSRKIHSNSGIVISVTEFITNGNRNILAGKVTLKGDARAQSKEERIAIEKFIRQISKGIAITHDVSIEVKFKTEFIETFNSKRPTDAVIKIGEKIGLNVIPNRKPMSFSEDFAHFSNCFPGCFFLLGNGEKEPFSKPLHSSYYNFNDDLIEIGRKFWVALVEDRLPKL